MEWLGRTSVGRECRDRSPHRLALILFNGLFALSELAVVSARRPRLKAMAAAGRPGANSALALAAQPGRFLSAVQIGITLIGTINGAYSGETFGEDASGHLQILGVSAPLADPIGFGAVVAHHRVPFSHRRRAGAEDAGPA